MTSTSTTDHSQRARLSLVSSHRSRTIFHSFNIFLLHYTFIHMYDHKTPLLMVPFETLPSYTTQRTQYERHETACHGRGTYFAYASCVVAVAVSKVSSPRGFPSRFINETSGNSKIKIKNACANKNQIKEQAIETKFEELSWGSFFSIYSEEMRVLSKASQQRPHRSDRWKTSASTTMETWREASSDEKISACMMMNGDRSDA